MAITPATLGIGEIAMLLCTRDCNIEQPPLFFEFTLGIGTQRGGENVLFETYHKDRGELKTLG